MMISVCLSVCFSFTIIGERAELGKKRERNDIGRSESGQGHLALKENISSQSSDVSSRVKRANKRELNGTFTRDSITNVVLGK